MQKNANLVLSRLAANLNKTLKVALPIMATMFVVNTANANEFVRYNLVDDAVGTADQLQNGGLLKSFFGPAINFGYNTTPDISPLTVTGNRVTVDTTAWDAGAPPQPSTLNVDAQTSLGTSRQASVSLTRIEKAYRFSFDRSNITSFGFYTPNNLVGINGSNPYYRGRNFRVIFSGVNNSDTPQDVTCTGVVDGGVYSSIPSQLSGITIPSQVSPVYGVNTVYLTLQRKSDNFYWGGTQWGTAQVNLPANVNLLNSLSSNQQWQLVNALPTLSPGQYTIRVMALQGLIGNPSPGTLRGIDFTISGGTPTPTPMADTTLPNPSDLTYPSPGSTTNSLSYLGGICSDNPGGSGVGRVQVQLTYEGSTPQGGPNPLAWNYVTRTWGPYAQVAATSAALLDAQVVNNGTQWNTGNSQSLAPTGALLYNGWYSIRTFTTDKAGNGKSYGFRWLYVSNPDTTLPNVSVLTYPSPGSTTNSLSYLGGTCSDNLGGSGVSRVVVQLTYEGSAPRGGPNPLAWNYANRTWVPYAQNPSGAYLDAQVVNNGTQWNTGNSQSLAPAGALLYNGWYTIRLFTIDNAGNGWSYTTPSVYVNNSGGTMPSSIQKLEKSTTPSGGSS